MKPIILVLALFLAFGAAAQAPPVTGPTIGPGPSPSRGDLWQMLTPEQREQLWRTLTPAQRSDLWRGLQPEERREMRERFGPGDVLGAAGGWAARRPFDGGEFPPPGKTMTPEERQQMREQIREAHRLRRERMEAERAVRQ
jgi:hypothetical protein